MYFATLPTVLVKKKNPQINLHFYFAKMISEKKNYGKANPCVHLGSRKENSEIQKKRPPHFVTLLLCNSRRL